MFLKELMDTFGHIDTVHTEFKELSQATVLDVMVDGSGGSGYRVTLMTTNGLYVLEHDQDCCETVELEEVIGGELEDLIGEQILWAEESTNVDDDYEDGTLMWTFYTIRTNKVTLTLRWRGESNGYYSVGVDTMRAENSKDILRWWRNKERVLEDYNKLYQDGLFQ